jgi:hypothetical protein
MPGAIGSSRGFIELFPLPGAGTIAAAVLKLAKRSTDQGRSMSTCGPRAAVRLRRIGVLMGYAENDPEAQAQLAAFQDGFKKLGWMS